MSFPDLALKTYPIALLQIQNSSSRKIYHALLYDFYPHTLVSAWNEAYLIGCQEKQLLSLSYELFRVVEVLFSLGLVHRDISPFNIFVKKQQQKLMLHLGDFAHCSPVKLSYYEDQKSFVFRPELLTKEEEAYFTRSNQDQKTLIQWRYQYDLFCLAVTVHYVLTGHFPYAIENYRPVKNPRFGYFNTKWLDEHSFFKYPRGITQILSDIITQEPSSRITFSKAKDRFLASIKADNF